MSRKYFVDDLFPCLHTSLICGPSGAGKSRWLLAMIADWLEGKPILGHKSNPMRYGYISCDRPSADTHELIEDMGLNERLKHMKIVSLMDNNNSFDYVDIPLKHFQPGTVDVLFIESFQALMPQGELNNYWKVLAFFRLWHQFCQLHQYSILGTVHPPKAKEGEGYSLQRDQIMGTGAWGAVIHGLITLTFANPSNIDDTTRQMVVSPRKKKPWKLMLDFDSKGFLIESTQEDQITSMILEQHLVGIASGTIVTTLEVKQWAMQHKVSERAMYRWLKETPLLERVDKGEYKVRLKI